MLIRWLWWFDDVVDDKVKNDYDNAVADDDGDVRMIQVLF